ncbi:esterase-like activity of phytase family protein [Sulfitobacter sp. LCG007]
MRWRTRVALIVAAAGIGAYVWHYPPAPAIEAARQPAQPVSVLRWAGVDDWFGGFSGLEIAGDGRGFYAVTDRGHLVAGKLERDVDDTLVSVSVESERLLKDDSGRPLDTPRADSEGLALGPDGRLYISFERIPRVMVYDTTDSDGRWASYSKAWRALSRNGALELLAIDAEGTLYTIPEQSGRGAPEGLVYRKLPDSKWDQPFNIPLEGRYLPVGADFGPDGRLYVLERDVYPFGFRSRVRSFLIGEKGLRNERTEFETRLNEYGNLEGLAVWRDRAGRIRLTMVADDNFLPVQRSQIVEFAIAE